MHDLEHHRQVLAELEVNYRFTALGELMAAEATYQQIAFACRQERILLSREDFLRNTFTITTSCDGLIAIAQRQAPLGLVLQRLPLPNGLRDRVYRN